MSNEQASTWRELWNETTSLLGDEKEARWICEEASGLEGSEFLESLNEPATMRMGVSLQAMVGRRLAGEPVQYVLGHWPFRHIDLLIDQRVLIPRPETEQVVEAALNCARQLRSDGHMLRIADIGTGLRQCALHRQKAAAGYAKGCIEAHGFSSVPRRRLAKDEAAPQRDMLMVSCSIWSVVVTILVLAL
jgi:hypothetical protein